MVNTRPRYKYQNMEDKYRIQIHHWSKRKSPGAKLLQVQSLCKVSMPVLSLLLIQLSRYENENNEANLGVRFVGATNQGEGMKNVSQPNHNNILRCSPLPG